MAILRDKITSAPIFEGSPVEVALAAESIGRNEVIFDDVGESFDPDAVLQANQEHLDGAQSVVADPEASDDLKEAAQATIDNAPSVDDSITEIEAALTAARDRVQE